MNTKTPWKVYCIHLHSGASEDPGRQWAKVCENDPLDKILVRNGPHYNYLKLFSFQYHSLILP